MKLYNTLTRKKEKFKPLHGKSVGIYTCGPTVYDYAHIGNLRAYIFSDILRRALESGGYKVKHVINITDVGHLTSNEDEGEDKIEQAAKKSKKSAWEIARFFENQFKADLKKLGVLAPSKWARATDHIGEQIELIKILEKRGFTYKTGDGLYFDTSKLKDYGKLAGQKTGEKLAGARVAVGEKKNPADFALWKFSSKKEKRQMEWNSPWGVGFPGWHIECSAMSVKYLGQPFDIHTGGIDHIPVHHENEMAQSEAAEGLPLAKYWLHSDFLTVEGRRMGKSEGNLIRLDALEEKGVSPLAYRYFVLGAHYRSKLNFIWEAARAAEITLKKIYAMARELPKSCTPPLFSPLKRGGGILSGPLPLFRGGAGGGDCAGFEKKFQQAIDDDLNTPQALAVLWEMLKSDCPPGGKAACLLKFDKVLGLDIKKYLGKKIKVPKNILELAKKREAARKKKDWKSADKLRAEIEKVGFDVEDTPEGAKLGLH